VAAVTQRLGVVGYPIEHSLSPAIHQAALDALGIDARYERWKVAPADLAAWVDGLRAPDVLGANVTVPHKEAVLPYLDDLAPAARAIGAVNTVICRDDRLLGANTDGEGFSRTLAEAGFALQRGDVVLLGAGGAARAVGVALLTSGVRRLTIVNRGLPRARALAQMLLDQSPAAGTPPTIDVLAFGAAALAGRLRECELLVNTTSVGLHRGEVLLDPRQVPAQALVMDLIYNPPETALLAAARAVGARTLNGLPMLVHQAARAFQLWTGREPPLATMFAAARAALP
jgi:shikimate dehydrogenase